MKNDSVDDQNGRDLCFKAETMIQKIEICNKVISSSKMVVQRG